MNKKMFFKVMILTLIMVISATLMISCNPKQLYEIPENLDVSIKVYLGTEEEANLLGTITNKTLLAIAQQNVSMTTVKNIGDPPTPVETTKVYVAYSMNDIIAKLKINLPETITSVMVIASDDYDSDYEISSFDNSYITIGFEEDGAFVSDFDEEENVFEAPRFISDKTSTSSKSVSKMVVTIIINPIA
ncbi:MAG: hypothetical protein BWX72_01440 [Firmicutes bacterium ADurb.Bin080]|nr:MAG: hypothetical protein BWX72_01440 [Firmicutes bacterium ADurb.Bin080]